jgi:hypothetical protein
MAAVMTEISLQHTIDEQTNGLLGALLLMLRENAFAMAETFFATHRKLFVLSSRRRFDFLSVVLTTTQTSKPIEWLYAKPEFRLADDDSLSDNDNIFIREAMAAEALDNVKWLITNGVDPSAALTSAVVGKEGNRMTRLEKVAWLFALYGDRIDTNTDDGMPLHAAAMADDFATVNFLLNHGADPNFDRNHTDKGNTLYALMIMGQELMARHLMSCGAKFRFEDVMKLYSENSMNMVNALSLFLESGGDRTKLTPTVLPSMSFQQTKFHERLA